MTALTVLKFKTPDGAHQMCTLLNQLRRQHSIAIHDAAVVSWPYFRDEPKTHRLRHVAGAGEVSGAVTGLGFDDAFVRKVRNQMSEGSSALILLTGCAVLKQVARSLTGAEMRGLNGSNFLTEEESKVASEQVATHTG